MGKNVMNRRKSSNSGMQTTRSRTMRVVAAVLLVAACTAGGSLHASPAHADDVVGLQAQARQIAAQLNDIQGQMASIGEQFNQAQVRLGQLDIETSSTRKRLVSARSTATARRADVSRYALTAYVAGNGGNSLPMALDGKQWDMTRRDGYVAVAVGDKQQLVDDLVAAQKVEDDTLSQLRASRTEQDRLTGQLAARQRQATSLMARQQKLQDGIQGQLAVAVAQQQAVLQSQAVSSQQRLETKFGAPPTAHGTPAGLSVPSVTGPASPTPPGTSSPGAPGTPASGSGTTVPRPTSPPAPGPTAPPATNPPVTAPPAPPVVPAPPPAASGRGQTAANAALSQLGVAYSWGGGNAYGPSYGFGAGAGIKGYDCSGLTLYAWAQAGVSLYHSAQMQYNGSSKVSISQLQVGDLVFYGTSSSDISHVSIYIGGGQVVHAPNSQSVVQIGPVYLWNGYFSWVGAGRPG